MPTEEVSIDRPIEERIVWAERFYHEIKDQLLWDDRIGDLLVELERAIGASNRERAEVGVVDECRDCEEREEGSCCGAGLENKYGGVLLLINLLLGVRIPKRRYDPLSCFFLGKRGCLLLARHTICVHYLCKRITDRVNPEKIAALREKEGIELELLFFLQERIKKTINHYRPPSRAEQPAPPK